MHSEDLGKQLYPYTFRILDTDYIKNMIFWLKTYMLCKALECMLVR